MSYITSEMLLAELIDAASDLDESETCDGMDRYKAALQACLEETDEVMPCEYC